MRIGAAPFFNLYPLNHTPAVKNDFGCAPTVEGHLNSL
jgi:hypothetical protein